MRELVDANQTRRPEVVVGADHYPSVPSDFLWAQLDRDAYHCVSAVRRLLGRPEVMVVWMVLQVVEMVLMDVTIVVV